MAGIITAPLFKIFQTQKKPQIFRIEAFLRLRYLYLVEHLITPPQAEL
jgi:hypothetical protein